MAAKVGPRCLGDLELLLSLPLGLDTGNLVNGSFTPHAATIRLDVADGLLNVLLDIKGVARGLGDGETEVQGDGAGNSAEADHDTPHLVDGLETAKVGG